MSKKTGQNVINLDERRKKIQRILLEGCTDMEIQGNTVEKRKDIFSKQMTVSEFKKSMLFENDDFDLRDVLEPYPSFDGIIKFDDETIEG